MSEQDIKPKSNPYWDAVRSYAHCVGLTLSRSRTFNGNGGELAIGTWAEATIKSMRKAKERGEWDFQVADEDTVRRRINELADIRFGVPTLWLHVPKKLFEVDSRTGQGRAQSTYSPNPEAYKD